MNVKTFLVLISKQYHGLQTIALHIITKRKKESIKVAEALASIQLSSQELIDVSVDDTNIDAANKDNFEFPIVIYLRYRNIIALSGAIDHAIYDRWNQFFEPYKFDTLNELENVADMQRSYYDEATGNLHIFVRH